MNNWETEFEVKYERIYLDDNDFKVAKKDSLIIEASTQSEVINIIKHRFGLIWTAIFLKRNCFLKNI